MKLIKSGMIERSKIHRLQKYKVLSQPLSKVDEDLIEADILENKQKTPVRLDQDFNLLDGFLRDRLLEKNNIDKIKFVQYHYESEKEKLDDIFSVNRMRRHYTEYIKCRIADAYYIEEKKAAELRKKAGKTIGPGERKGEATELAAKAAGTSRETFKRYLDIKKSDQLEKYEKDLISGVKKIKTVHTLITRKERNLPKVKLPKQVLEIIVADVPYGYNSQGGRGAAETHYPTMTAQEIAEDFKKLNIAENAVIFFWMSPSIMYDTIGVQFICPGQEGSGVLVSVPIYKHILDAAGFRVKAEFVWDKEKIGLGNYNRIQHENLLYAVKGEMPIPAELFPSIIKQLRTKHSRKPNLWKMIKKMFPGRNYSELYATEKTPGVLCFGNQLEDQK